MEFLSNPTVIFFIANTLYMVSYMVTSMMWLRILAVIAALSTFPYFFFQPEPLWSALFWQAVYLVVNLVNLVLLVLSMRAPNFDELEAEAYRLKFSDMKPHEVVPIFKRAGRRELGDDESLLAEGQHNQTLYLIIDGHCMVEKDGMEVATLNPGNFVGEFSLTSGEPTSANVFAKGPVQLLSWSKESMKQLGKRHQLLASYLHQLCCADLADKLRNMTRKRSDHVAELENWLLEGID